MGGCCVKTSFTMVEKEIDEATYLKSVSPCGDTCGVYCVQFWCHDFRRVLINKSVQRKDRHGTLYNREGPCAHATQRSVK